MTKTASKVEAKAARPIGRPTKYAADIADAIIERMSDGEMLTAICGDVDMPSRTTAYRWLSENPSFQAAYTRAREEQAHLIVDEMIQIADDISEDMVSVPDGKGGTKDIVNAEHIQRSRVRIETRKWIASRLLARVYGDKLEVSGDPTKPVVGRIEHVIVQAPLRLPKPSSADAA